MTDISAHTDLENLRLKEPGPASSSDDITQNPPLEPVATDDSASSSDDITQNPPLEPVATDDSASSSDDTTQNPPLER